MAFTFLKLFAVVAVMASTTEVGAQTKETFPDRPITVVVAYPAGPAVDSLARLIGEGLTK